MYIPTGDRKGYPPKTFTNPNYLQNGINSDTNSDSDAEPLASGPKPTSDWDEDLIDLTKVDNASNQNKNPLPLDWSDDENLGGTAKAQPQATPRQPPPGWASWRKRQSLLVTNKEKPILQESNAETPAITNSNTPKLTIEKAKSIAEKEFHSID